MKTIEEKRELFLDMQEHPENYSEQELQAMLDDPEMADDINAFEMLREAERYDSFSEKLDASLSEECGVRSEELYALYDEDANSKSNNSSLHTPHSSLFFKYAAMFIGIIMLGGIAYAAIRFMNERTPMAIDNENTEVVTAKAENESTAVEKTDSIAKETTVQFDDAELGDILSTIANHYGLKLVYENEAAKSIKLFLKWNKAEDIEKVLEVLNAYDRINIEHRGDVLIVK